MIDYILSAEWWDSNINNIYTSEWSGYFYVIYYEYKCMYIYKYIGNNNKRSWILKSKVGYIEVFGMMNGKKKLGNYNLKIWNK